MIQSKQVALDPDQKLIQPLYTAVFLARLDIIVVRMARSKEQIRKEIAEIIVLHYIPQLKEEVTRFNYESIGRHNVAQGISEICGKPIGVYLGELRIAKPTNALIDKLVDYVRVQENT